MSSGLLQLGRSPETSLDARPVLQQYATISEHEVTQTATPRVDWGHTPWSRKKYTFASLSILPSPKPWGRRTSRRFASYTTAADVSISDSAREGKRHTCGRSVEHERSTYSYASIDYVEGPIRLKHLSPGPGHDTFKVAQRTRTASVKERVSDGHEYKGRFRCTASQTTHIA